MKIRSVLSLFVFAACGFAQINFGTPNRTYSFPPVGLASSETAQVNIVSTATALTGSPGSTTASCSGTITFTDAGGKTIGSPANFTITSSQISSTQLTFSQLGASGTRGEFQASIAFSGSSTPSTRSFCSVGYSLETFDTTTGATHVYFGNSATTLGAVLIPGTSR